MSQEKSPLEKSSFTSFTKKKEKPESPIWRNTTLAEHRLKENAFYEETGLVRKEKSFAGRPIISRDKPINGGVYLGSSQREAIVVDDQKDQALNDLYQELLKTLKDLQSQGKNIKKHFLEEVYSLVQERMPYDEQHANKVRAHVESDGKIFLSRFLGGGVCRHQALLVGYLLERLGKDGYAGGKVSIDRNIIPDKGGHAWARYKNSAGVVFIIDVAQGYIGKLEDKSEDRWFYERPEDRSAFIAFFEKLKRRLT